MATKLASGDFGVFTTFGGLHKDFLLDPEAKSSQLGKNTACQKHTLNTK